MSDQLDMFSPPAPEPAPGIVPDPSSGAGGSLLVPPHALCMWCMVSEATAIIYEWPTCLGCAVSPKARVAGYQQRLRRAAGAKNGAW